MPKRMDRHYRAEDVDFIVFVIGVFIVCIVIWAITSSKPDRCASVNILGDKLVAYLTDEDGNQYHCRYEPQE